MPNMMEALDEIEQKKKKSCYECTAYPVCLYTPVNLGNRTRQPPYVNDACIAVFLRDAAVVYANACKFYTPKVTA